MSCWNGDIIILQGLAKEIDLNRHCHEVRQF